jgi:alkylation response protein AidB-like acyl-CoA dehydrogenase
LGIIEGTGEPRIFVLPVEKVNLIDNWNVMGLRATGSIDYTIDSVYVPDSYTHFAVTDVPKRGGSLYTVGIVGFAAMCHSGWACGIGRRLLDELAGYVRTRGGRTGTQSTSESFLEQYAKAEGTYRSARALVYEVWGEMSHLIERGEQPSVRLQSLVRLAMAHVQWASHDVAMFVYAAAGTTGLRAGTIQRLFRDMHAGTQHLIASPPVFRALGRELAGLAPKATWRFVDLIEPS